ncbi:MAG: 50S ribosomal protein L10 [Candidatus Pacebacteria bacterium]|nr:50S ribosomal protein L10 [Candidatus Paceibacterota bacterium]
MALTREKKGEVLKKLKDIFGKVSNAVFVNFHGLTVGKTSELRRSLHGEQVTLYVAKKTLLERALSEAGIEGTMPALDGEIAIAYPADADSSDVTAAARGVYSFEKKLDGKLSIVGGIFDRAYRDQVGMLSIATIPSMQTLRGMFANVINSPIQRFAIALQAIADKRG